MTRVECSNYSCQFSVNEVCTRSEATLVENKGRQLICLDFAEVPMEAEKKA